MMTEAEWLASSDSHLMLSFLKGKDTDRKMRLFAAACCRRVWHRLPDQRSRNAIETAERYVEGSATQRQLRIARRAASVAMLESDRGADGDSAWALRGELVKLSAADTVSAYQLTWLFNERSEGMNPTGEPTETKPQCDLLRELFGHLPFRPVAVDAAWRTSDVMALAQGIYEERAFDRMPILADALQDAGCESDDILNHFRDPNATHVRGCWALDLILGKS
jgi:hypothetical protein